MAAERQQGNSRPLHKGHQRMRADGYSLCKRNTLPAALYRIFSEIRRVLCSHRSVSRRVLMEIVFDQSRNPLDFEADPTRLAITSSGFQPRAFACWIRTKAARGSCGNEP